MQAARDREKSYVLKKVGSVAYKIELPQELSRVHNTFHVSNLKKCYSDEPLTVPLEGLHVDDKFRFVEEPIEIMDREVKRLKAKPDVVLKTSFGTSWTLKDVMYIPSLKRRLISVRQLDEEGYHVGFGDQQWKVTKGGLVVAHVNKLGSLYMVEVVWEAEESFFYNVSEDKETTEQELRSMRHEVLRIHWGYSFGESCIKDLESLHLGIFVMI
ncbi:hypothetical protein Tco_0615749 [Tanacetum coccineum]